MLDHISHLVSIWIYICPIVSTNVTLKYNLAKINTHSYNKLQLDLAAQKHYQSKN